MIDEIWSEPFGDRRQEMVFICTYMDKEDLIRQMDNCLLTNEEMKSDWKSWEKLPDPFPQWSMEQLSEAS